MTYAQRAVNRRTRTRRHRRHWFFSLILLLTAAAAAGHGLHAMEFGTMAVPDKLIGGIPQQLLELYERNPETKDFVLNYPENHAKHPDIDLSEEAGSGTVPLLMQWDERWGYDIYAGDYFGLTGCGPTCLSMVALYCTGDASLTPAYLGYWAAGHGYAVNGSGTAWALFTDGAAELGLTSRELPLSEGEVRQALERGEPVVCIMGPGDFTTTGHFIVLTEWTRDGIRVNDPNSHENSEKLWKFDDIRGQIQNLWAFC